LYLPYRLTNDLQGAVKKLDKNNDKMISFDEFSSWWQSDQRFQKLQGKGDKVENWCKCFKQFDKNQSGVLEGEEIKQLHAELSKKGITDKSLEAFTAEIDTNKNGNITFNEYVDWLLLHDKTQHK